MLARLAQRSHGALRSGMVAALRPQGVLCRRPMSVAASAAKAKEGDFVSVHYTGTLDDGSVFDSSRGTEPLDFIVGGGQVIKGFDMCVTGLAESESRKQRVAPEDAYGAPDPSLVLKVPKAKAPEGLQPGMQVQLNNGMVASIIAMDDNEVTVDLNHELAGKHLTFDVELVRLCPRERVQFATFGAGCFWGPELAFQRVPGVLATETGYSNGSTPSATYEDVCSGRTGHAEVVKVMYDPKEVSFSQLLDVFWQKHDPTLLNRQGEDVGQQYRSAIYYTTPEQKAEAEKSLQALQERLGNKMVVTELEEESNYCTAEPHHQQFLARGGRFGKPQSPQKGCTDPIRCYG